MSWLTYPLFKSSDESKFTRMARISFGLYLLCIFFGTTGPFPSLTHERDSVATTNFVNQLLSLLFVISAISLWGKQTEIFAFVRREKFLTIFFVWTLVTILWSPVPVVSLKRWITLFGELIICLAALLHFRWSEVALKTFRPIIAVYVVLSILAVLFVHEATQWSFPAWRGLAPTKNNLGQIMLYSIIVLLVIISYHKEHIHNIGHYILLGLAVILYIGAKSTTSFMVGLTLLAILGIFYAARWIGTPPLARFYGTSVLLTGGLLLFLLVVFAQDYLAQFFSFFGKDLTFTGRVELWNEVYTMALDRIWIGWGIGGFWVMDSSHLKPIFDKFIWIPNQAHQGYIDVLSQTGIAGLILLICIIVNYFRGLVRFSRSQVWKWLVISLLVLNFQESVFFRPRNIGHFLFLFSYVALFVDLNKEKRQAEILEMKRKRAEILEKERSESQQAST